MDRYTTGVCSKVLDVVPLSVWFCHQQKACASCICAVTTALLCLPSSARNLLHLDTTEPTFEVGSYKLVSASPQKASFGVLSPLFADKAARTRRDILLVHHRCALHWVGKSYDFVEINGGKFGARYESGAAQVCG